ncbi:ABC transporter permease [Thermomonas sp.]|uniref:ABC transporter permease n=1 Tax=Thermomonas sp. TaxID=1971895 RepID=UPI0035B00EFD
MHAFLLRSLLGRAPSLVLTVLGLAVAFAATLAALNLHAVLRGGHPQGTNFAGEPVSIFAHITARDFDLFLFPPQIIAMQEEMGDSGAVISSSGARMIDIGIVGAEHEAAVDVVSPNFFTALGVAIKGGDARQFGDDRTAPTCVVSEQFIARMGLQSPPETLQVAGRALRVVGIARDFNGLWDHETDVWVDWRLGHDLLSPTTTVKGIDGFYWTMAIPARGQAAVFRGKLQRALSRRDLAEPPFDSFRAVPGITNQPDMRRTADTSSWLYLVLCAVMLVVATANLAAWSALLRAGKIQSEWTFLQLGIPRRTHALLGLGFVVLPVLAGALLALPLERVMSALLQQDSAIYALLAWSAEYKNRDSWRAWLAIVLAVTVFGWLLGLAVVHLAGLRYDAGNLRTTTGKVERLFRPMAALVTMLASIALLFGTLQTVNALRVWQALSQQGAGQVWALFINTDFGSSGASLDHGRREAVVRGVRAQLPRTQALGFVKIRPLSTAKEALSAYSLDAGGPPVLKVLLNEADAEGMQAIGADLRAGRAFDTSLSAMELVLDAQAAQRLVQATGKNDVLGMNLYDELSMPWRIVGIVDRIPYGPDPDKEAPVGYVTLGDSPMIANLVLRGPNTAEQAADLAETGVRVDGGRVRFGEPANLAEKAEEALAQYRSRALLGLIAAAITIIISALTILSIVTLEVRRRRRMLAVRASLGEGPLATAWHGARGVLIAILLGTILGMLAMWLAGPSLASRGMLKPADFAWAMPVCSALLMALACVGAAAILLREFFAKPLAQHLREE